MPSLANTDDAYSDDSNIDGHEEDEGYLAGIRKVLSTTESNNDEEDDDDDDESFVRKKVHVWVVWWLTLLWGWTGAHHFYLGNLTTGTKQCNAM